MSERRYSRAHLLRLAGVGAGAAVGGPLLRTGEAWARGAKLKVGVLAPSGSHYPRMGEKLLAGLELGLERHAASSSLVVRRVEAGYGGARESARELLDSGADVVVAGVTAPVAQQLEPLFREQRKTLLVANVGAHVVRPDQRSPWVIYNSLLDWQASFAMGVWAAGRVGRRALVLTSLSDAGYDAIYAFRRGFGRSGGQVVETIVTHDGDTEPLHSRLQAARELSPTVAYVVATGPRAAEIVRAYRASGPRAPLLASPFAVEDYVLPSLGAAGRGIRSVASWATAVRRPELRRPDPFEVLGYESALLLAAGLRPVKGLRGPLRIDRRTNTILAPLFLRKVRSRGNAVVGRAPSVGAFPRALHPIADETTSGYLNEYLCA